MIGYILDAVLAEAKALLQSLDDPYNGGIAIFKTDYSPDAPDYPTPLLIIDLADAPEMSSWLGGATRADYVFGMNAYSTMPDSYLDNIDTGDDSSYSTLLLKFIDTVRRHFQLRNWLTAGMPAIEDEYGFRFTLEHVHRAEALKYKTGFIKGLKLMFNSISVDDVTDLIQDSTQVLENVVQVGSDQPNELYVPWAQTITIPIMANTTYLVPAGSFVPSIAMQTAMGTPSIAIGTTPGGSDVSADQQPGIFALISAQLYCEADTTLYFTMTGTGIVNTRIDIIRNYLPKLVG